MRRFLASFFLLVLVAMPALAQNPAPPGTDVSKAPAGVYALDKSHARLTFKVSHTGMSMYQGRFNDFDVSINLNPTRPEASTVEAIIHIDSIDTRNSRLEQELRSDKFFNTASFTTATFKSRQITRSGASKGTMTGDLTFMGVTRPVTLNVTFYGYALGPFNKKDTLGFAANTVFKRSDWGFTAYIPAVGDEIQLEFDGEFNLAGGTATTPPSATTPNAMAPSPTAPISPAVTPPEPTPAPSATNKPLPTDLDKEPTAVAPPAPTVTPVPGGSR